MLLMVLTWGVVVQLSRKVGAMMMTAFDGKGEEWFPDKKTFSWKLLTFGYRKYPPLNSQLFSFSGGQSFLIT
jgi:hypothetical protein